MFHQSARVRNAEKAEKGTCHEKVQEAQGIFLEPFVTLGGWEGRASGARPSPRWREDEFCSEINSLGLHTLFPLPHSLWRIRLNALILAQPVAVGEQCK